MDSGVQPTAAFCHAHACHISSRRRSSRFCTVGLFILVQLRQPSCGWLQRRASSAPHRVAHLVCTIFWVWVNFFRDTRVKPCIGKCFHAFYSRTWNGEVCMGAIRSTDGPPRAWIVRSCRWDVEHLVSNPMGGSLGSLPESRTWRSNSLFSRFYPFVDRIPKPYPTVSPGRWVARDPTDVPPWQKSTPTILGRLASSTWGPPDGRVADTRLCSVFPFHRILGGVLGTEPRVDRGIPPHPLSIQPWYERKKGPKPSRG